MEGNWLETFAHGWTMRMGAACWQGGLAILAVWIICRVFKRMDPGLRQILWWVACLKFLVAALWTQPVQLSVGATKSAVLQGAIRGLATFQPGNLSGRSMPTPVSQSNLLIGILVVGWLLGFAAVATSAIRSGYEARKLVKDGIPIDDTPLGAELRGLAASLGLYAAPRLLASSKVSSPCVVWQLRPVVIVPVDLGESLTSEEQHMALAHELAHLRRGDLWLGFVPSIVFALFFFFPPVWLACREWATDREASCDIEAIETTGAKPNAYGQMLMKIAKGDHRRIIPGFGATRQFHTLKRRLNTMVSYTGARRRAWTSAVVPALAVLVLVPIALASGVEPNRIVGNPGFEEGTTSPDGWQGVQGSDDFVLSWDEHTSHSGKRCVSISRSQSVYWPIAQWSHEIPYDGKSRAIEFGAWIKAERVGKAVLDVQFFNGSGQWSHRWVAFVGEQEPGSGLATHDWAPYSGAVMIPAGTTRIVVALQDYGPGTVWMDDVFAQFDSNASGDAPSIWSQSK